jgi:hypothetical protein
MPKTLDRAPRREQAESEASKRTTGPNRQATQPAMLGGRGQASRTSAQDERLSERQTSARNVADLLV